MTGRGCGLARSGRGLGEMEVVNEEMKCLVILRTVRDPWWNGSMTE